MDFSIASKRRRASAYAALADSESSPVLRSALALARSAAKSASFSETRCADATPWNDSIAPRNAAHRSLVSA